MNKHPFKFTVNQRPHRTCGRNGFPFDLGAMFSVAKESSNSRCIALEVAYAEKETAEPLLPDRRVHRMGIVATRLGESKAMMGMPFADVVQTETLFEQSSYREQIVHILIEEGVLVVRPGTGADGIHDHRDTVSSPITEKLPSGLDVGIVQDATRQIVELRLEHDHSSLLLRLTGNDRTASTRPDFKDSCQALPPCVDFFMAHFR